MFIYESIRRWAREREYPDWRHRPGPEAPLQDWPHWGDLTQQEQEDFANVLNPVPPPAVFVVPPGQEELPPELARSIEIDEYEEHGRIFTRRNATDNELRRSFVELVRATIEPPVVKSTTPKGDRKTDRPSRPRSPGSKTQDLAWIGLELWDIHFYQLRELTKADKKAYLRTRKAAREWFEYYWSMTHI